jgi:hypothetical protein
MSEKPRTVIDLGEGWTVVESRSTRGTPMWLVRKNGAMHAPRGFPWVYPNALDAIQACGGMRARERGE